MISENFKNLNFPIYRYGTCTNVEESRRLTKEMQLLPESLPQMVWKTDTSGNTVYANGKFRKYTGLTEEASCNVFSSEVVHPEDYEAGLAELKRSTETQTQFEIKRRIKSAKGKYQQFMTRAIPIVVNNNVTGFYGTCTEV